MRIAIKVLGRELVELSVFERFHLMDQPDRDVHALARFQHELLNRFGFRRFFDADYEPPRAQIEGFCS